MRKGMRSHGVSLALCKSYLNPKRNETMDKATSKHLKVMVLAPSGAGKTYYAEHFNIDGVMVVDADKLYSMRAIYSYTSSMFGKKWFANSNARKLKDRMIRMLSWLVVRELEDFDQPVVVLSAEGVLAEELMGKGVRIVVWLPATTTVRDNRRAKRMKGITAQPTYDGVEEINRDYRWYLEFLDDHEDRVNVIEFSDEVDALDEYLRKWFVSVKR
jgi:hypothetical protein